MKENELPYTVVSAKPEDIKSVIKMQAESWLDTYPDDRAGVSRSWVEERVRSWLTLDNIKKRQERLGVINGDRHSLYKIAVAHDGSILGVLFVRRQDGKQHLGMLYVDKKYHGKGIAQDLMKAFLEWEDTQLSTDLEVATYNKRAIAFYKKYDFHEVVGSEHFFAEIIPVITMVRKGEKQ